MPKIVVTHDLGLSLGEIKRLKTLGDVTIFNSRPKSDEEWLDRCQGADIICSGISGLKNKYQELRDVFISLPLVGASYLDKEVLRKKNIKVSNSPGCNKDAVAEWITGMMINLLRELKFFISNKDLPKGKAPAATRGLAGSKVLILGEGSIGKRVGEICNALKMEVSFFKRGDNLAEKTPGSDVIVNCLSTNETTKNLLDNNFFNSLKKGSFFITVGGREIYDPEAMFAALDNEILSGVAIDDGTMVVGDTGDNFYEKLLKYSRIIATPHIAYNTNVSNREGNRMMIDNIKAYLDDKPINLI